MSNKKISIVTISFNQKDFLEKTILSVISQKNREIIEYIVVDPGSSDGSRELLENYKSDIDFLIFENDSGPADGLNKGFSKASCDIFYYLNSDDLLLPGALEFAIGFLEKNKNIDVLVGDGFVIDGEDNIVRCVYSDYAFLRSIAFGASIQIQPSTFFRKKYFHAVNGFNINNKSNWDGELLVDMILAGAKCKVVKKKISAYRIHGASITGSAKLVAKHKDYQERIKNKILGDKKSKFDRLEKIFWRLFKYFSRPRSTVERIIKGPIFGAIKK